MNIGKIIIKIVYCVAVLFLSLYIFSALLNRGNTDMTTNLQEATFPVLNFVCNGMRFNTVHGSSAEMDITENRECITPLLPGRRISIAIDTFGNGISKIGYELRNIEDGRLIEDTSVYNYLNNNGTVTADITLKDLIEDHKQYSLCIKINTEDGQEIRYYTRIIEADEYFMSEALDFVYYFTETTFDYITASSELKTYMESNNKGDNSSFHYVDIHSSMDQLTWGNLNPEPASDFHAVIKEMDKTTAWIEVYYTVSIGEDASRVYYRCVDTFRVVLGADRMHLMEYYRSMDQVFSLSTGVINNNKIMLGITDTDVNMLESQDGNQLAFVSAGRLYSYNASNSSVAYIFGFYEDGKENDERDAYSNNDIKILSIDEAGNIYFAVYGYMNRGIHEGRMGISVFYYDSVINNIDEKLFIESDKSFERIRADVETLCFASPDGEGYFYVDNAIYRANLLESTAELVVQNIPYKGLVISTDGDMVAWVSGGDLYNATQIVMLNLDTGDFTYVEAENDSRILPIGFFTSDLIYGIAKKDDIQVLDDGEIVFAMNRLIIRDEKGNILKEYSEEGYYISEAVLSDSMLKIYRIMKTENGYIEVSSDEILNNKTVSAGKNVIDVVVTENYETIVQIATKKDIDTSNLKMLKPRIVIYEGSRELKSSYMDDTVYYYVYIRGELYMKTDDASEAVDIAYNNYGYVTDINGIDIYYRGNVATRNQIMAITQTSINDGESMSATEAVCLNTVLNYYGVSKDTRSELYSGKSMEEILGEALPDKTVIDLTGCSLDTMMYYLNKDIPVITYFGDDYCVLIVGFNELNTVIMNPYTDTLGKVGKNDTATAIASGGQRFLVVL